MADPQVRALVYLVAHGPFLRYASAPDLQHSTNTFDVCVRNDAARFSFKAHFASVEEARAHVEPFIRDWELLSALNGNPDDFTLRFERAEVLYRAPPFDGSMKQLSVTDTIRVGLNAVVMLDRGEYPAPPLRDLRFTADVETMIVRYGRARQSREPLASAAYFCATVLSGTEGWTKAAARLNTDKAVLLKLKDLATTRGGPDARKAEGRSKEFSSSEIDWIHAALKRLIIRAAEIAHDRHVARPRITMGDLPKL